LIFTLHLLFVFNVNNEYEKGVMLPKDTASGRCEGRSLPRSISTIIKPRPFGR
jgi:hypothetical protein